MKPTVSPILRLPAGSITPDVVVCGDAARAELIARRLDDAQLVASRREYTTYAGSYRDLPVTVTSHGVGAAGAAIAFEELFRFGARSVVRIGTCGTYLDRMDIGAVLIGTGASREEGVSDALLPRGFPCVADPALVACLESAARGRIDFALGVLRTHGAFYPGSIEEDLGPWMRSGAVGVEMEFATLLAVATLHGGRAGGIFVIDGHPHHNQKMDGHNANLNATADGISRAIDVALDALVSAAQGGVSA